MLAVETASFDLRFGGEDLIRDRYLFYVVPLFLVAAAVALSEEQKRPAIVGLAGATVLVAAASIGLAYTTFPGISVDSPVSILNETLAEQSGSLGPGRSSRSGRSWSVSSWRWRSRSRRGCHSRSSCSSACSWSRCSR